jgi:hypothetical protein
MKNKEYPRRKFISQCLNIGSLFCGGALFLNSCNTNESPGKEETKRQGTANDLCNDLSGVSDEEITKRQGLGYVTKSTISENYCGNCGLYIPPITENDCGRCLLFKGPVYKEGHCAQWVAKTS